MKGKYHSQITQITQISVHGGSSQRDKQTVSSHTPLLGDQPGRPQTVICEICVICGSYLLFLCGFAALRENFLYLRLRVLCVLCVLGRRSPCSIDYFLRMPGEVCFVVKSNLSELCVSVVK